MTVKRPQPNGLDHGPGLVDKASALLSAFEEVPERTAAELAEVLDEPVSSTYRMIASLIDLDILAPSPERGRYRLGLATAIAGSHLEDRLSLHEAARPRLQRLTRLTNATALIMVRSGMEAVCVDRVAGNGAGMIAMGLGGRLPLWIGGAPMAILANLAPVDRDGVIDCLLRAVGGDLPTPPPSTIDHEIGLTLERGYSMTRGDT
ncbi:MAG: helix-turn-helix domain-containing protein, partial [Micrococcales bacterium]|nr:helix-turn-helix domain-containing protein [Micrococcales bacterium]